MGTRIICLEEHCVFPELLKAAQAATAPQAPYYGDLNSRYRDAPDAPGDLPALRPVKAAIAIAGAPMDDRISAMDDHGIHMQILSHADMIRLLAPNEAIEWRKAQMNTWSNQRRLTPVASKLRVHPESSRFRADALCDRLFISNDARRGTVDRFAPGK